MCHELMSRPPRIIYFRICMLWLLSVWLAYGFYFILISFSFFYFFISFSYKKSTVFWYSYVEGRKKIRVLFVNRGRMCVHIVVHRKFKTRDAIWDRMATYKYICKLQSVHVISWEFQVEGTFLSLSQFCVWNKICIFGIIF